MLPSSVLPELVTQASLGRLAHSALPNAPVVEKRPRRRLTLLVSAARRLPVRSDSRRGESVAVLPPAAPSV